MCNSDFNHFFVLCAKPKKVISITFLFLAAPPSPPPLTFKLET